MLLIYWCKRPDPETYLLILTGDAFKEPISHIKIPELKFTLNVDNLNDSRYRDIIKILLIIFLRDNSYYRLRIVEMRFNLMIYIRMNRISMKQNFWRRRTGKIVNMTTQKNAEKKSANKDILKFSW